MEESDIKDIIKILKQSQKFEDWELVEDAISYLREYLRESDEDEE